MKTSESSSTFEDVVTAVSKLSRDVEYLERGIRTLAARLRLADQERYEPAPWDQEIQKLLISRMPKSLPAALIAMENIHVHIKGSELNLSAIRSGIDDLLYDAGAMKTWRQWQGKNQSFGKL